MTALDPDTIALIDKASTPDEFGRTSPLAVYGTNPKGHVLNIARNLQPTVESVTRILDAHSGWTDLHVTYDLCG